MINILFDCDVGHDDAMAIFNALANKDKLNIIGYTTVSGNNHVDNVTKNLCNILSYLNEGGDIVKGYNEGIMYPCEPQIAHGVTGLDGPVFNNCSIKEIDNITSNEFIKSLIEKYGNITILALAPLTNIAMFIKTYPHLKKFIDKIIIMGGSIYRGNILKNSEFNIYADPHSASIVFNSGIDIVLAPLEVCDYCSISHDNIDNLKNGGKVSKLAYDILYFFSLYTRERNMDKSFVFDLSCSMYLLYPELFEYKYADIDVVLDKENRGQTIIEFNDNSKIKVLINADSEKIEKLFLKDLKKLDLAYK